jgi:hypothetical protein
MKVRYKDKPYITGWASHFNTHSAAEVLVTFPDGDATSESIHKLQCYCAVGWKNMAQAFKDRDILPDNYNTFFGIPDAEEKKQGFLA